MTRANNLVFATALSMLFPYPSSAVENADIEKRVAEAKATSAAFLKQLGGAMKKELQAGGPAQAISVCRDLAPAIANKLSLEKGWKVTRVATRVRNPMIGTPDVWEQKTMKAFADRAAKGEAYSDMVFYEVVDEPDGKYLRFAKAIGTAPKCLLCHGSVEQIPETVRKSLTAEYPHDVAINYQAGDLRGAVSIKQPLSQ